MSQPSIRSEPVHRMIAGWMKRLAADRRGLTVSAVILIGILVVAVAAFGIIAADKIADAGAEVEAVDFG